ncbi:MAG TPA: DUF2461 domain-containing protein [Mycobacteriales bacterium]|jgi:uncharacterized protein (TIGR02453 family)|nr:DUF2461 domain-containing protein [Mycobacteriales bacterium]
MGFSGFPEEALDFYEGLEADNSKAYWTDHKAMYDDCVAAPMRSLLDELEPRFGTAKMFRPYRDVRFSKDKSPYKTRQYAVIHTGDQGWYVGIDAQGLHLGGGMFTATTDQVAKIRAAIADAATGPALGKLLKSLRRKGFIIGGHQLKRVPKPWDDNHPRADLLRHKSLIAYVDHEPAEWLHTARARDETVSAWQALEPLNRWLAEATGG